MAVKTLSFNHILQAYWLIFQRLWLANTTVYHTVFEEFWPETEKSTIKKDYIKAELLRNE
jgi:hypothetical protein